MRFLKRLLIGLLVLVALLAVGYFILDKPLPEGKEGPAAEALADKLLAAVNLPAWDTLGYVSFASARSGRAYVWDKTHNMVESKWKTHRCLVRPDAGTGLAYTDGKLLDGTAAQELVKEAIHWFWNDSFWLCGYFKVRDPGTTRKVVALEEGGEGLLVQYSSGGTTPGDAYLWKLDAQGRPTGWQMWTQVLPIGGLSFTWEGWQTLPGGAQIPTSKKGTVLSIDQENLKGGQSLAAIGLSADLFAELH
jgi:hypothetical protein